jgi:hypothetical protein
MTSSAGQDFLSDVLGKGAIPPGKLAYFQTRLAGIVNQAMLKIFGRLESQKDFMRRDLAVRIGRKPEQITRWLSYPGNLTLSTVSDIFAGMGYEIESITLKEFGTGKRLQCPSYTVDWMRLADIYGQKEYQLQEKDRRRPTALDGQSTSSHTHGVRAQIPAGQPMQYALDLLPVTSIGKAESAQLQAAGRQSRMEETR